MSIKDLDHSVRAFNCLERAGVKTVGQLTQMSKEELIKIRNLGRYSLQEICTKLEELGLSLND